MKPSKDFLFRLAEAERWQDEAEPYIREIFRYCAPQRQRDFDDVSRRTIYESDTFSSLPEELATDLASDLVTYFTPAEARWMNYVVVTPVDEDDIDAVRGIITEREDELFNIIASSNYNDIAPQWGFETATHGTPALWITQSSIADKMHVEVVPPHELLIVPGHRGILDRFREQVILATALEDALSMPGISIDLSEPGIRNRIGKPGMSFKVVWGFWVDWADVGNPRWRMEVTVDGKLVTEKRVDLGPLSGACPLQVGRFNPQPTIPWGRGPGWKALPDMRVSDAIDEIALTAAEQSMLQTIIYPNDGTLDMSNGIEAGRAYPAGARFSRDQIFALPQASNPDMTYFASQNYEERLRRAFYQDGPRQRGQTPPTATQWLDERRRIQQRIGKPSAPLWSEMIVPMIQRIEHLAVMMGRIPEAISHNDRDIIAEPISPLQKAQNNDKVMTTRSNLELAFNTLGENVFSVIDPVKTLTNIATASGDELLALRTQETAPDAPAAPE